MPSSTSQRQPSSDHGSNGSNPPVAGNIKGTSGAPARRTDPIHRAFSVHGSISIRAKSTSEENSVSPDASHSSQQLLNLPFFATVCRSLFTAALIDPVSGLTSGTQQSSGQLVIDFGSDSVVGSEYHRDILLVNRSEIELVWNTAVVNARHKDAVWFSLRDLDSENVFGVDTSSQPVPLPALSSRHLRLDLRVKAPIVDFDFDFVISNVNQSGNIVPCRAVGSGQAEGTENSLVVLSGTTVDFGQICDGVWAKKLVTCKNNGGRPLDAHFSATPGFEVVFRLAGVAVAGDDMDVDIIEMRRPGRVGTSSSDQLSRTSTRDSVRGRDRSSHPSRGASPSSSLGRGSSFGNGSPNLPGSFSTDLSKHLGALDLERNALGTAVAENPWQASVSGPELSLPPSRPLSGVTSRASSYRYHTSAELDEDDVPEIPFFKGGEPLSTSPVTSQSERMPHVPDAIADKNIPNQMEDLTMRPGTEYRIFVLYRPARDALNPPDIAGALRESTFKVFLDSAPSSQRLPAAKSRRTLNCTAESCTSLIAISPNKRIDFGEVTVGAVKSTTISIANLSALSAKVEIAAISKVLSANRNIIVVPPYETVEEKLEFFPRRINDRYEKQLFVRNLLNRSNDQLVEIRSKNVDVYNLTLHSHLYRILTPSGSNFLDFNHVVINSPSVRSVLFDNVTSAPLVLELSASQPEDVELYVKLEDAPMSKHPGQGKYADDAPLERVISPSHGHLKERFMEAMREIGTKVPSKPSKPKGKVRDKSVPRTGDPEAPKQPVEVVVGTALKRGGRGRPVQVNDNMVLMKVSSLI